MLGAVSFSLDERLVTALQAGLPLRTFVETGTYKGDTLARMLPHFDVLKSVELSKVLWEDAAARFVDVLKVSVVNADSPDFLASLQRLATDGPTLYWLDAHWCAVENVAGEASQCPLLAELRAIGSLLDTSVILIDDARLFLAPPASPHEISQWPRFHDIITTLLSLSTAHEVMVVNDVIAFFPKRVRAAMEAYAQNAGVDWIAAAGRVGELLDNETALREKEEMIQTMARSLTEKEQVIQDNVTVLRNKENMIQTLASSLTEKEGELQAMARSLVEKERVIQDLIVERKPSKTRPLQSNKRAEAANR